MADCSEAEEIDGDGDEEDEEDECEQLSVHFVEFFPARGFFSIENVFMVLFAYFVENGGWSEVIDGINLLETLRNTEITVGQSSGQNREQRDDDVGEDQTSDPLNGSWTFGNDHRDSCCEVSEIEHNDEHITHYEKYSDFFFFDE